MTFPVEEDGWLVEPLDTPTQESVQPSDTTTRHCKRCRKDQPVENFVRPVSEKQALYLARKEGLAETTDEYFSRAALHKTVNMAHKLCNVCAAKLRKEKPETAEEMDNRLRMLKRFERHVPNPYYVSPSRTPREPLTITERELKVRAYRQTQNARRVDGRRKADKDRKGKTYAAQMREITNEMQRINVRMKGQKVQDDEAMLDFYQAYMAHLRTMKDTIREERYSHSPAEPLSSTFKYINLKNQVTAEAMKALHRLDTFSIEKAEPRLLPTAEILNQRYAEQNAYAKDRFGVF